MEAFFRLLITGFGLLDLVSRLHHGVFNFVQQFADQRNLCLCTILAHHMSQKIVEPSRLSKSVITCQDILTSEFFTELIAASQNEIANDEKFMYIRCALRTLYSQLHATKHELQTMLTAEAVVSGMPGLELSLWENFKTIVPPKLDEMQRVLPVIMRNFYVEVERPPEPCMGVAHHFYLGREVFRHNVQKVLAGMSVRHSPDFRHPPPLVEFRRHPSY